MYIIISLIHSNTLSKSLITNTPHKCSGRSGTPVDSGEKSATGVALRWKKSATPVKIEKNTLQWKIQWKSGGEKLFYLTPVYLDIFGKGVVKIYLKISDKNLKIGDIASIFSAWKHEIDMNMAN